MKIFGGKSTSLNYDERTTSIHNYFELFELYTMDEDDIENPFGNEDFEDDDVVIPGGKDDDDEEEDEWMPPSKVCVFEK